MSPHRRELNPTRALALPEAPTMLSTDIPTPMPIPIPSEEAGEHRRVALLDVRNATHRNKQYIKINAGVRDKKNSVSSDQHNVHHAGGHAQSLISDIVMILSLQSHRTQSRMHR